MRIVVVGGVVGLYVGVQIYVMTAEWPCHVH